VRIELGPRDMEKGQFVAVRRDTSAKLILKIDTAVNSVTELLDDIHDSMYRKYAVTLKCLFAIFGVLTLTLETKKEKTHTHTRVTALFPGLPG